MADSLAALSQEVTSCTRCPRLVEWRERSAAEPPRRYQGQSYWARPLPGFGDPRARIVIVGLAPAAHGGNRTGRIFTGDRSGDWLFAALHRAGLAESPTSTSAYDGQRLIGTRITLPVRCAPPANRPTTDERDACAPWLHREIELLRPTARAFLVLGGFGGASTWSALRAVGFAVPARIPAFGHGRVVSVEGGPHVIGCYHVSQQNTFTGRLTEAMLDEVIAQAKVLSAPS